MSSDLLQKVLKLVPLAATGPKVYDATTTTFSSGSYDYLVDNLNHMKSLKSRIIRGGMLHIVVIQSCYIWHALRGTGAFNTEHLGYIICIFEYTSDSRFHLWATQNYKGVVEFVKKHFVCNKDVMQSDDIITYSFLVLESLR